MPPGQGNEKGTMRENRTLSVYTQPTGIATARPHTRQKTPRYCDAHFHFMRVQQRKLFLDFAENFSLPANDPEKKKVGAKKKRLPGVIVGRALVLLT